jgi:hypothetical protein
MPSGRIKAGVRIDDKLATVRDPEGVRLLKLASIMLIAFRVKLGQ